MKLNIQISSIDTLGPALGSTPVRARTWFGNPIVALLLTAFLLCGSISAAHAQDANGVCRASMAGNSVNNGADWAHSKDLMSALNLYSCAEIWVAQGTYTPVGYPFYFTIRPEARVFGGFAGTESLRNQRDWLAHPTVLSGDKDNNDTNTDGNGIDESYHDIKGNNAQTVVQMTGTPSSPITSTTVLDGFIISGGDGSKIGGFGGGMLCRGVGVNAHCSPTLSNLVFSGNAAGYGGALYLDGSQNGDSSPQISHVIFNNNHATQQGGALFANGLTDGTANPTLSDIVFNDNVSDSYGGAIYSDSRQRGTTNMNLTNVTFDNNNALYGGAMMNFGYGGKSSPSLFNVTFSNNSAQIGGAMYNQAQLDVAHGNAPGESHPTLRNVTFSHNHANGSGGAMYNWGAYNGDVNLMLNNVTFSDNSANLGGAVFSTAYSSGTADATLSNVILWGNTASSGQDFYIDDTQFAISFDLNISYSVVQGGDAGIAYKSGRTSPKPFSDGGFNYSTDPELGALADNGGFTLTMAPGPNGSAVNHGICAGAPSMDQRGVARPNGSACDIGAVEALPDVLFANGFEHP
ncbi:MAG TPA: choice-of-anchor Q domain-containing protein [Rudaea sp.]|nr:choice-of-anchor Q domain-containing protein [Rudaea sp.]